MTKLVAIISGGDWYDASVEHIVLPKNSDMDKLKAEYDARDETERKKFPYYNFTGWLKAYHGARDATEDECLIYWEY